MKTQINQSCQFAAYAMNRNGWALGISGTAGHVPPFSAPFSETLPPSLPLENLLNPAAPISGTYQIWESGSFGSFSSTTDVPVSINEQNEVIVSSTAAGGGYLWTDGGCAQTGSSGAQPMGQLVPAPYQKEISAINPIAISSTNAAEAINILFNAQYQTDSKGDTALGTFMLTVAASGTVPLTISPATTNSGTQTITVTSSGSTTGDNNQIVIGVGTTTGMGGGLGVDVKPMTTGTIAIHTVTQHYTAPMVLLSGMVGTPGTICVSGSHVLNTSPASPDQYGPDGSLTIVTGSDGVCHTTAAAGDTQVIPVGQAIPADIVPADTPTAADLQTYLNQVFGVQANLYFTVTRSDVKMNYDLNNNGILDISALTSIQSGEEKAVMAHADNSARFNIYYVRDYQELLPKGNSLTVSHSAIGSSNWKLRQSFIRDNSTILRATAHEVGHLLDLRGRLKS